MQKLVDRHLAGEPVAYLIGEWGFYGLPLDISPDVLIPRPDTEVLVEEAVKYLQGQEECRVLDLCSGSGCIGLALASQVSRVRVVLGEYSDAALKICRQNIRRNGLSARVVSVQADARERPGRTLGEFQCIISNPPYIPTAVIATLEPEVREHEPMMALDGTEDGLRFYRQIAQEAGIWLKPGGAIYLEIGYDQGEAVSGLLREAGFDKVRVVKDLPGKDRVVCGVWPG